MIERNHGRLHELPLWFCRFQLSKTEIPLNYKLPFLNVIAASVYFAWTNKAEFLKAIFVPTLALVVVGGIWGGAQVTRFYLQPALPEMQKPARMYALMASALNAGRQLNFDCCFSSMAKLSMSVAKPWLDK